MSTRSATLPCRCWRWIRQRPIRSTVIGCVLFAFLVPVWPYKPVCDGYSWDYFRRLDGRMTSAYLAAIDPALWRAGVHHLRIGDRIFLPLVPHDPDRDFGLYDAQERAVNQLVGAALSGSSSAGRGPPGPIHRSRGYLRSFVDDEGRPIDYHDCAFVRAVAFGEPPPPGYVPKPSFLDRTSLATP